MKRFITIPRSQHQGILPHLTFSHSLDQRRHSEPRLAAKVRRARGPPMGFGDKLFSQPSWYIFTPPRGRFPASGRRARSLLAAHRRIGDEPLGSGQDGVPGLEFRVRPGDGIIGGLPRTGHNQIRFTRRPNPGKELSPALICARRAAYGTAARGGWFFE